MRATGTASKPEAVARQSDDGETSDGKYNTIILAEVRALRSEWPNVATADVYASLKRVVTMAWLLLTLLMPCTSGNLSLKTEMWLRESVAVRGRKCTHRC